MNLSRTKLKPMLSSTTSWFTGKKEKHPSEVHEVKGLSVPLVIKCLLRNHGEELHVNESQTVVLLSQSFKGKNIGPYVLSNFLNIVQFYN